MSSEKATAIVIRTVDFGETSLVVTLFSREFGKLGALAKGAKRLKGPFESALDLLALCRVVFLRKTSDALDLLTEAKLLRRFRPGKDLFRLYAGYYVAELLAELTDEDDPHPALFELADETLAALIGDEPAPRRIIRFELGLLRELGHMPSWEICVECGRTVPASGRIAFGHIDGGVLCAACRAGKKQVASVSAGTIRTLAELADPLGHAWRHLELAPQRMGELRGVLNQYLTHLIGRRPRMHAYLGKLWTRDERTGD
jgi:DNA repair protein RecO (recombination protein O)